MKQFVLMLGIFCLLTLGFVTYGETKHQSELEQMIQQIDKNDGQLVTWRLYARGKSKSVKNKEEYDAFIEKVRNITNLQWDVEGWQERENWQVSGKNIDESAPFQERLMIYAPMQDDGYSIHLSFEIYGDQSIQNSADISSYFQNQINQWFDYPPQIFTTVEATLNEVTDLDTFGDEILQQFSAKKVEELNEKTFIAISAYNKKWMNALQTNGQKMNLQIALRQDSRLGAKTTLTIGTPIITTEY